MSPFTLNEPDGGMFLFKADHEVEDCLHEYFVHIMLCSQVTAVVHWTEFGGIRYLNPNTKGPFHVTLGFLTTNGGTPCSNNERYGSLCNAVNRPKLVKVSPSLAEIS